MRAHSGNDERRHPGRFEPRDDLAHDQRDVGDAAAADGDRDR